MIALLFENDIKTYTFLLISQAIFNVFCITLCIVYVNCTTELLTIGKEAGLLGEQFIFFIKQLT